MPRVQPRLHPTQTLPNRRRVRPHPVKCAVCRADGPLLHFCLLLVVLAPDGRSSTRGAGAIDLCQYCWAKATREGAIRARPKRPPRVIDRAEEAIA